MRRYAIRLGPGRPEAWVIGPDDAVPAGTYAGSERPTTDWRWDQTIERAPKVVGAWRAPTDAERLSDARMRLATRIAEERDRQADRAVVGIADDPRTIRYRDQAIQVAVELTATRHDRALDATEAATETDIRDRSANAKLLSARATTAYQRLIAEHTTPEALDAVDAAAVAVLPEWDLS